MNILHLNTHIDHKNLSFPHYRYHKMLEQQGHNSVLLVAQGNVQTNNIKILNKGKLFPYFGISKIVRKLFFKSNHYFFPEWNLDYVKAEHVINSINIKPDIIIAYLTKFAFNQKLLYELSKEYNAPVLCVGIDHAPLTGGCHFPFDCTRYKQKCGRCPAINSTKEIDLSRKTWEFKKKYIDMTDITFLSCTSNFTKQVKESSLYRDKHIEQIILPVDEEIFTPLYKDEIRKELELPLDKKVIFFGAVNLEDKRKGLKHLIEALEILNKKVESKELSSDIFLLIAGKGIDNLNIPFEYKLLGYLKDEVSLAKAYQASDLFVCPSIEDVGPLMINQSIMSGRPVVAFDMGVAPDLVHTGNTGYLAKLADSGDLAVGIESIISLDADEWTNMSHNCRRFALEEFSLKSQYERINEIIIKLARKKI